MRSSSRVRNPSGDDCRCLCGSLLARVVDGRVELRCRRCKRTVVVPLEPEQSTRTADAAGVRRAG